MNRVRLGFPPVSSRSYVETPSNRDSRGFLGGSLSLVLQQRREERLVFRGNQRAQRVFADAVQQQREEVFDLPIKPIRRHKRGSGSDFCSSPNPSARTG